MRAAPALAVPASARPAKTIGGALARAASLRCAVCDAHGPFHGLFGMDERCAACGYRFEREGGYFLGSIYANYGITCGLLLAAYTVLEMSIGPGRPVQTAVWFALGLAFPLWFYRYARQAWMVFDLYFSELEPSEFAAPAPPVTPPTPAPTPAPTPTSGDP